MISRKEIQDILDSYDLNDLTVGVLGGHSALDVAHGAKMQGFRTVAVCQKGREKTYAEYYRSRDGKGCIDEVILVDSFADIVSEDVQKRLRELNTVFVHNRYFWVYCDFEHIENIFKVPIYGTRQMVKLEERDVAGNQYELLKKAGIRMPKIFKKPEKIDRLVIVKVNEAERGYERAFFKVSTSEEYFEQGQERVKIGLIKQKDLDKAVIEEFVLGAQVNFNFFYSPLSKELELLGTDMRRQTNLDGFLRLTEDDQRQALETIQLSMIETGHVAVTMKESLLEKAYELAEKFVKVTKKEAAPGIIGPFALQGAVVSEKGREDIVIFDVSMRIPGSPGTRFTPYSGYLYGKNLSYGERIGMELRDALNQKRLKELVT